MPLDDFRHERTEHHDGAALRPLLEVPHDAKPVSLVEGKVHDGKLPATCVRLRPFDSCCFRVHHGHDLGIHNGAYQILQAASSTMKTCIL